MNSKTYILILIALILIPAVTATIGEGIEDTLSAIFDASGDLAYIKAGIWLVLFFLIFKSAERIFPSNRGAAMIIALVIAILGSRFMPDEYLEYVGGWYSIILGIVLLMIPFFLGSVIGDMVRWGRTGKTFLIILFYIAAAYIIMKYELPLKTGALSALGVALEWMSENRIIVLIVIIILCIILLWRGRSGVPVGVPSGGGGPSFWGGLGRGARGAGNWAAAGGRGIGGWIARRRAIARQRAMLKSGWVQKKEQLLQQMPKGKVPARGTQGYEQYMKNMILLDRVRRKLGEQAFLRRMRGKKIF